MNNLLLVTLLITNLAWMALFYFMRDKDAKREEGRFREFIIANKSQNLAEYTTSLPDDAPPPVSDGDELIELNEVPAETLLKDLKKGYGVKDK